jgi:hypothetical protein
MYSRVGSIEKDSSYIETKKYVKLNTSSITYKNGTKEYLAQFEFVSINPNKLNSSKKIWVVDKEGKPMKFSDDSAFLNYMDECGYEMVTEKAVKYGSEFTFKRKS